MGRLFAEAARSARIEAEVSLRKVAEALGWTPAYVSDMERGNRPAPSLDVVRRWARIVGADPTEFERLAVLDRESVELPIQQGGEKSELAIALLRHWGEITDDQAQALAEDLRKLLEGRA